jgi:MotA/TolQ/ExbB proton channel family
MIIHRVFLYWLLYLVIVLFGLGVLVYLGLPQLALHYDHSYLTVLLFAMYAVAEVLSGRQAWLISQQNRIADRVVEWLSGHKLDKIEVKRDASVVLYNGDDACTVPQSAIAEHLSLLSVKANAGQRRIRQNMIIDVTADRLYSRAMIADFIGTRIVWVGILATILGVIMAFWPMINGLSVEAMKSNISEFFGGIAVAFIPTAVSFVCKIVLDFNTRIITSGVRDLIDKIACVSETAVLPFLDGDGDTTVV